MFLYLLSVLHRHLLANAIDLSMALSDILSWGTVHVISDLL